MKKYFLFLALFVSTSILFCYSEQININIENITINDSSNNRERQPRVYKEIDEKQSSITIKSNVTGADVYLNGIYQGRTDLVITDLTPGYYQLEIKKRGYETEKVTILVRRGYECEYYIELEKIYGYIQVQDLPEDAKVSVSGAMSTQYTNSSGKRSCIVKVEPGNHEVVVKKFGYNTFSKWVDVAPYKTSYVSVELIEAVFELNDFKVDKKSFNPAYSGRLGKCTFSFNVTAPQSAVVIIKNSFDTVVWEKKYDTFTTWEQSFDWNGRSSFEEVMPDGEYTAYISAGEFIQSVKFNIDSSISYPIMKVTKVGAGVGGMPLAFKENSKYSLIYAEGGVQYYKGKAPEKLEKEKCSCANGYFGAGMLFNFAEHCELGINANTFLGKLYDNPYQICTSFKFYDSFAAGNGTLCYGGLIRYGWSSEKLLWPYGIDCGNGLGGGLLLGYDVNNIYVGIASQYIFGASKGIVNNKDSVWNNGLCLTFVPQQFMKFNIYGGLDSAIGVNWLQAYTAGVEIDMMPESSAFIMSMNFDAKIIKGTGNYYSGGITLSYLF